MRIMRLAVLALVAVVAMSFAVVASASAAESTNPLFTPVNNQTVRGSGGASHLSAAGRTAECEKNTVISGNVTSSLLIGGIVIHYLGCVWTAGEETTGCPASSVGATEGLILTKTLHAVLGILLPSGKTGVLFLPQAGAEFVKFAEATKGGKKCAEETAVTGSVAATVEPVGVSSSTGTVKVTTLKEIDLTHGLGLAKAKLTAFSEAGTLVQSDEVTFGQSTEVT
jgi:hypothetical protein